MLPFRIGEWTVDTNTGELTRGNERRHLRPKVMDLLVLLAETPGDTVGKETIIERLWPDAIVEDGALAGCISELRAALEDDTRKPRFVQTRPRRGYRLIAAVEPADGEPTSPAPIDAPRQSKHPLVLGALLAVAVTVVGVFGLRGASPRAANPVPATASDTRGAGPRVVVLAPTHLAGDASHAWIGRAVAHLLTSELAMTTNLRLVPADAIERSDGARSIADSRALPSEALAQLRQLFGVDFVLSGHYVVTSGADGDLRLDLLLTDAMTGEIRSAAVERGPPDLVSQITTMAALRLREDLGWTSLRSADAPASTRAGATALPAAYFRGLLLQNRFAARDARMHFEQAITAAPEAAWPRLALAESWSRLGYDQEAATAVATALARADDLNGEERLWFESRAHALSADWDEAVERLRALRLLEPDNLAYRLALVETLVQAGRMAEARETIQEIPGADDEGPGAERAIDPRWTLLRGEVALAMGDRDEAREAAAEAIARGQALRAPSIEARALELHARVLHALGEIPEAESTLETARLRFTLARNRSREAQTHVTLSQWLARRGEDERAATAARTALTISREIGDRSQEGAALRALGAVAWTLNGREIGEGHLHEAIRIARETGDRGSEADALNALGIALAISRSQGPIETYFREALTINRSLGHRQRLGASLRNVGRLAMMSGELDQARTFYEEAESLMDDLGPEPRALIAFNVGYLRSITGDTKGAYSAFREALTLFRGLRNEVLEVSSIEALASTALVAGDYPSALAHIRESLSLREERNDVFRIPRTRVVMSRILLASERVVEAEAEARKAYEETQQEHAPARPAVVEVLALILLETGRLEEARAVISELAGAETSPLSWSEVNLAIYDLTRSRIDGALGDHAEARERAEALRAFFAKRGASPLVLEADYVLLELDLRVSGRLDESRADALAAAAHAQGQAHLARRVTALNQDRS